MSECRAFPALNGSLLEAVWLDDSSAGNFSRELSISNSDNTRRSTRSLSFY